MRNISVESVRGTGVGPLEGATGPTVGPLRKLKGHGRQPADVLTDSRLAAIDTRVHGVLALTERQGITAVGERLLAKYACTSRSQVRRSIGRLMKCGYVELIEGRRGTQRQRYRLTDPIFARKEPGARRNYRRRGASQQRLSPVVAQAKAWATIQRERGQERTA